MEKHDNLNENTFEAVAKSYIGFCTYCLNEYSGYESSHLSINDVGYLRLVDLFTRLYKFGVRGHIVEGDLAPQDLEDIEKFAVLETAINQTSHPSVCKTLQYAFMGRIKLCAYEQVPLEDIYDMQFYISNEKGLSVEELAALSNTSVASVRNEWVNFKDVDVMKSHEGKPLLKISSAAEWLKSRKEFKPNKNLSGMAGLEAEYVNVPVAADGTYFCFACEYKRGGYTVGIKGNELKIDCYDEALKYLTEMPLAKWRRPNSTGNYGIVRAVEWRRIKRSEL